MFATMLIALAGQVAAPVVLPPQPRVPRDFPQIRERNGPTPWENHPLPPPHWKRGAQPDLAIKDVRIDRDTLYVLVTNQGKARAEGSIIVGARAESAGARHDAVPARVARLNAGESRWVAVRSFATGPAFALDKAKLVSAVVLLRPADVALDRSGQTCDTCAFEADETNNGFSAEQASIKHGRPS